MVGYIPDADGADGNGNDGHGTRWWWGDDSASTAAAFASNQAPGDTEEATHRGTGRTSPITGPEQDTVSR